MLSGHPAALLFTETDGKFSVTKTAPGGRNHLNLSRSDLVIQAGGHMRAFFGRAYLVDAIPAGVSSDELR